MLLGYKCHFPYNITQAGLSLAIDRLKSFLFVGVQERYADGVRAFHEIMQQDTKPAAVELEVHRGGRASDDKKAMLTRWLNDTGWTDPFDSVLHKNAEELFESTVSVIRAGKYRIKDSLGTTPGTLHKRPGTEAGMFRIKNSRGGTLSTSHKRLDVMNKAAGMNRMQNSPRGYTKTERTSL